MNAYLLFGHSMIVLAATSAEIDETVQSITDPGGTIMSIIRTAIVWIIIIGAFVSIEKAPIKFNPISMIASMIFKPVNEKMDSVQKDFDSKIEDVQKIVNTIKDEQDRYRFSTIRWEILSFRTSLNNGDLFTEVEYQHIKDDYEEYKELHKKYGFTNGYLEDAMKDIDDHHDKYKDTNTKYF